MSGVLFKNSNLQLWKLVLKISNWLFSLFLKKQYNSQREELAKKNYFQKDFQAKFSILSFYERVEREKTKLLKMCNNTKTFSCM
jgi:hypothetical protein